MTLCLGDWHPELPFFMTWRLSRHFCFRPSNFTAFWGPRANSGKAHPFCSSTCILAGLHKLLTYRSCSHSVWIIQLLKLSREGSLQATQCTLAHERKGLGRGCKANNNNKKNFIVTWATVHGDWLNSFCLFNQSCHIRTKEHLCSQRICLAWQLDLICTCFLPHGEWQAIGAGLAYKMNGIVGKAFLWSTHSSDLRQGCKCGALHLGPRNECGTLGQEANSAECYWIDRCPYCSLWQVLSSIPPTSLWVQPSESYFTPVSFTLHTVNLGVITYRVIVKINSYDALREIRHRLSMHLCQQLAW